MVGPHSPEKPGLSDLTHESGSCDHEHMPNRQNRRIDIELDGDDISVDFHNPTGGGWTSVKLTAHEALTLAAVLPVYAETLLHRQALTDAMTGNLARAGITTREAAEALTTDERDRILNISAWGGTEDAAWAAATLTNLEGTSQ